MQALGAKEAALTMCTGQQARRKRIAVIITTHDVLGPLTVGDHIAVLIVGAKAADFHKRGKTREKIADLTAGGRQMAEMEAYQAIRERWPKQSTGIHAIGRANNDLRRGPLISLS